MAVSAETSIIIEAINRASTEIRQVQTDLIGLGKTVGATNTGMAAFSSKLKNIGGQLRGIGLGLTASLTLPLVLLGRAALKTSEEFEQSITNAFSVMQGASESAREELTLFARQLGKDTAFTASEAADGIYKLASAGLDTKQIIKTLNPVLALAAATQSELADVAEQATVAMKVFGLEATEAERIMDTFAAGIANTNLNFSRIQEAMKFAAPSMAAFGKTVEETTAALGLFANAGIFGTRAGTGLRRILSRLADPTAEMVKVFGELGIAMDEVNPATKDLGEIFDVLQESGINATQTFRAFGQIAATPVVAVLKSAAGQGQAVSEVLDELEGKMGKTGLAAKIAAEQMDTVSGEMRKLKSSLDEVFLSFKEDVFGDSIKEFIKDVRIFVNGLGEIPAATKRTIVELGGLLAIIGPLTLLIGGLTAAIGTLLTTAGALVGAVVAISAALIFFRDSAIAPLIAVLATFGASLLIINKLVGFYKVIQKSVVAMAVYQKAIQAGTVANLAFGKSLLALAVNPIVLAAAVITSLVALFIRAKNKATELAVANENLTESFKLLSSAGVKAQQVVTPLQDAIDKTREASDEVRRLETQLQKTDLALDIKTQSFDDLRKQILDFLIATGSTNVEIQTITGNMRLFGKAVNKSTDDINKFGSNVELTTEDLAALEKVSKATAITISQNLSKAFDFNVSTLLKSGDTLKEALNKTLDGARKELGKFPQDVELMFDALNTQFLARIANQEGIGAAYSFAFGRGMTSQDAKQSLESAGATISDTTIGAILAKSKDIEEAGEIDGLLFALAFEDAGERAAIRSAPNVLAATIDALDAKRQGLVQEGIIIGTATGNAVVIGLESTLPSLQGVTRRIAEALSLLSTSAVKAGPVVNTLVKSLGKMAGIEVVNFEQASDTMIDLAKGANAATEELDNLPPAISAGGSAVKEATKEMKEMSSSLKRLGIFAVREGGKIVDTFDSVEEGVEKVKDRLAELDNRQAEFASNADELGISIRNAIATGFGGLENVVDDYADVEEVLVNITKEVETLQKAHQKFIDDAVSGLDKYGGIIQDINKEYDELLNKTSESAAIDIVEQYNKALDDQVEVTGQLAEAQKELDSARSEGDQDSISRSQERVDTLKKEKATLDKFVTEFKNLTKEGQDFSESLTTVQEKISEATIKQQELLEAGKETAKIDQTIADLRTQELILLGKQKLAVDERAIIEAQLAEDKLQRDLSEIDFIAYKLGKELEAINAKRAEEIKAQEDIAKVQAAISGLSIDELSAKGFSDDFIAEVNKIKDALQSEDLGAALADLGLDVTAEELITKYQEEEQLRKDSLDRQLELLERTKEQEVEIAIETRLELQQQQALLEEDLTLSYDRLIVKLKEVEAAAIKALAAKRAAASSDSSGKKEGGFGFASGGFTGAGSLDSVAGLVHKGEWVAPNWMVKNFRPMIDLLEGVRQNKARGFEEGGMVGGGTTFNTPVNMKNIISSPMDFNSIARNIKWHLRTH